MTNQRVIVESTPMSRWKDRYKKKYGYMFYGSIFIIGLLGLSFKSFIIGIPFTLIGGIMFKKHYEHHN